MFGILACSALACIDVAARSRRAASVMVTGCRAQRLCAILTRTARRTVARTPHTGACAIDTSPPCLLARNELYKLVSRI
eukprot:scaffold31455_cov112-Isochrysis_galbana.AAC.3